MILAGIDESGYGPTLGPLVVSAAAFRVPDELGAELVETDASEEARSPDDGADRDEAAATRRADLWELLAASVTRRPDGNRVPVDDSKRIHRPGKGLGGLEEGVLPFVSLASGEVPGDLRALLRYLCRSSDADAYLERYPWYRERTVELPTAAYANFVRVLGRRLGETMQSRGIEFLGVASAPIEVLEFNQSLESSGNKAAVPFEAIGELLRRVRAAFAAERVDVVVDRQGGRINYGELLYRHVRPRSLLIESQSAESSTYELRGTAGGMRVTFTRQGDAKSFAVALASMASKYLRELHMLAFNRFWAEHHDTLKPTAGYPTDARRFLRDIAAARQRLGIGDEALIRRR